MSWELRILTVSFCGVGPEEGESQSRSLQRAMAAQVTGKDEGGDMCQHFQLTDLGSPSSRCDHVVSVVGIFL